MRFKNIALRSLTVYGIIMYFHTFISAAKTTNYTPRGHCDNIRNRLFIVYREERLKTGPRPPVITR